MSEALRNEIPDPVVEQATLLGKQAAQTMKRLHPGLQPASLQAAVIQAQSSAVGNLLAARALASNDNDISK
jgi:hypothetical protein